MTPLLLTLGIYCMVMLPILNKMGNGGSEDPVRINFLDSALFFHLAGLIYFSVKVSDLIFGWSA